MYKYYKIINSLKCMFSSIEMATHWNTVTTCHTKKKKKVDFYFQFLLLHRENLTEKTNTNTVCINYLNLNLNFAIIKFTNKAMIFCSVRLHACRCPKVLMTYGAWHSSCRLVAVLDVLNVALPVLKSPWTFVTFKAVT